MVAASCSLAAASVLVCAASACSCAATCCCCTSSVCSFDSDRCSAVLVLLKVADDLIRVLGARQLVAGRRVEVRGVARLGRAVDVGLDGVVGDEPLVDVDRRLGPDHGGVEGGQRVLRVLGVLFGRVVLLVEDGRLLLLLRQRGLDLRHLRLRRVDLRLVRRRARRVWSTWWRRLRTRRQERSRRPGSRRSWPLGRPASSTRSVPTIHCTHLRKRNGSAVAISAPRRGRPVAPLCLRGVHARARCVDFTFGHD